MAYGRQLYTTPGAAIDAAVIYDTTEAKMQNEINAAKMNRSGGIMTGSLTLQGTDSITLQFKTTAGNSTSYIRAYKDSASSSVGNNVVFNTAGALVIGSGEFAANAYSAGVDECNTNTENLHIGSDSDVFLYTNTNTIANRKTWKFTTSGITEFPSSIKLVGESRINKYNSYIDLDASSQSAYQYAYYAATYDKDGGTCGTLCTYQSTSGTIVTCLQAAHKNGSGTIVWNTLGPTVTKDGAIDYYVSSPAAFRNTISSVYRGGDTMTGSLNLKGNNVEDGVQVSAETVPSRLYFKDKNDAAIGYVAVDFLSDGRQGTILRSQRTINGSLVSNYLGLFIDNSGTRQVLVNEAAAWRKMLGIGSSAGALPITIAQGGTGATSVANAKANLGLGTADQNFSAGNFTGTEQLFGISAKCVNTNSSKNGKTISLVIKEHGLFAWNNTEAHSEWDLAIPVTVAQGGTGQNGISKVTAASQIAGAASGFSFTTGNQAALKWGKVAQIHLEMKTTNAITIPANGNIVNVTMATLLNAYKPANYTVAYASHDNSGFMTFGISTDGSIQLCGADSRGESYTIAANSVITLNATYLLAN